MNKYVATFETENIEENKCKVKSWKICDINNLKIVKGESLLDFFNFCIKKDNIYVYIHNLKIYGSFILYYALKNGYKSIETKKDIEDKTVYSLISKAGQFYNIVLYHKKQKQNNIKTELYDILKILPFSVEELKKCFDIKESEDIKVLAIALKKTFNQGLTKMTRASNAFCDFRKEITVKKFNAFFPVLPYQIDKDIRQSYLGGICYLNKDYINKNVKNGYTLDINSLYSSCVYDEQMPYRRPGIFSRKI